MKKKLKIQFLKIIKKAKVFKAYQKKYNIPR